MRLRSLLFVPATDERKLRRAFQSEADGVIADLEDAITETRKAEARAVVAHVLADTGPARSARLVRVNVHPRHLEADLRALEDVRVDAVVLPKATPEVLSILEGRASIPIVESARGLANVRALAEHPGVVALLLGTIDLSVDLGVRERGDGLGLLMASSTLVLESAAAGIGGPIDGVHLAIEDAVGLRERATFARSIGFAGKACIHPKQVMVVNEAFAPNEHELRRAKRIVAAYEEAIANGRGVLVYEGEMVDLATVQAELQRIAEAESDRSSGVEVTRFR